MKSYTWRRERPKGSCAAGSIRTVSAPRGVRIRICCPKGPGHWKCGACRVGTVAYEVGHPKRKAGK